MMKLIRFRPKYSFDNRSLVAKMVNLSPYGNISTYRYGIGDPTSDYYVGNSVLATLTSAADYILRIDMWDTNNNYYHAEFDTFHVSTNLTTYCETVDNCLLYIIKW